jgi:protein translocase, SecG subunit
MNALYVIAKVVYIIICVVLTVIVLMQEGKNAGLGGSISGAAETYWGKNKGRSMEGTLVWLTRILAAAFIILSVVLNMTFWPTK